MGDHVPGYKITASTFEVFSDLCCWKQSHVTLSCFDYIHLHSVSLRNVLLQVVGTFASLITEIALNLTTFLCHMKFQHIISFEDSRAIFTFEIPFFTNALFHVRAGAIVGNGLITLFAFYFPV